MHVQVTGPELRDMVLRRSAEDSSQAKKDWWTMIRRKYNLPSSGLKLGLDTGTIKYKSTGQVVEVSDANMAVDHAGQAPAATRAYEAHEAVAESTEGYGFTDEDGNVISYTGSNGLRAAFDDPDRPAKTPIVAVLITSRS